jgi:porin
LPEPLASFGGLRPWLSARGVTFQLNDIAETFGNLSGGLRRGATLDNRLELVIDADLEKLVGWKDGSIHLNGYQINGTGPSRNLVGNILTISNIEALPSTRLYEAWFEQKLADGKLAIRVGQLTADGQFINSDYAGLFVNGTFGWPGLLAANLPSGGPAYPLATPGVRVKYGASDNMTVTAGLFNGDPAKPGTGDAQARDRHGLNFRVTDPPFVIGEAQVKYGEPQGPLLPGMLKFGGWAHFGHFNDLRFGTDFVSLAAPTSNGFPFQHRKDYGVYAAVDQQVYVLRSREATKGIGVFGRLLVSPADRNLVDFYVDGGINFTGVIASRPEDSFGLAVAYANISRVASALDMDAAFYAGQPVPIRDREIAIEATYNAQILPGWYVQPTVQYVSHPGGNVVNPVAASTHSPIRDAFIFGLRTTTKY